MIALHSYCHNENAEYATSPIVRSPVVRATVRETHWNKVLAKFHDMRKLNDAAALHLLAPNSINVFAQCSQLVHNYGHKPLTATSSPP